MQHTKKHIDCFVNVIDNFGDMGCILEFCLYYKKNYPKIKTKIPEIENLKIIIFISLPMIKNH